MSISPASSPRPRKAAPPSPKEPTNLGEPVFGIPFSGWYWQIKQLNGASRPDFVSDSLLDQQLDAAEPERRPPRQEPDAPRLCARSGRAAPAHRRARDQARRPALHPLFLCRRRRRQRDRPRPRRIHHHADRRTCRAWVWTRAGDLLPGAFRSLALARHAAEPGADPLGRGRAPRRRPAGGDQTAAAGTECADPIQSRDRRSGAHPCRQSRACAQDAAQRHLQRSADARGRRSPARWSSRPRSCATRSPIISTGRGSRRARA